MDNQSNYINPRLWIGVDLAGSRADEAVLVEVAANPDGTMNVHKIVKTIQCDSCGFPYPDDGGPCPGCRFMSKQQNMNTKDNVRVHATGAVRSKDADHARYDLLSPIAMRELGFLYHRLAARQQLDLKPETRTYLDACISYVFDFLEGDTLVYTLAKAAACLMEHVNAERCPDGVEWLSEHARNGTGYDLIPPRGVEAYAEAMAEGAAKYPAYNWEKGFPVHDLINHALNHIYKHKAGDRSEPHLPHAIWNLCASIHSYVLWPHLNVGTLRGPGCTPPASPPPIESFLPPFPAGSPRGGGAATHDEIMEERFLASKTTEEIIKAAISNKERGVC